MHKIQNLDKKDGMKSIKILDIYHIYWFYELLADVLIRWSVASLPAYVQYTIFLCWT